MPGEMHVTIGKIAWNSLSNEDRRRWNTSRKIPSDAPDFIRCKLSPPRSIAEKIGSYCLFLDLMGWDSAEFKSYPEFLLNGKSVPHGAADHNLNQCMTSSFLPDPESHRIVLRYFIEKAVNAIKQSNMEKALLFAGLIAHFMQDGAVLGHIFPNSLFYELDPLENHEPCDYHSIIDYCEPVLETVEPEILGNTVSEVVFRLSALMDDNIAYAKHSFFPLLEACRNKDQETLDKLTRIPLQRSVFQTASLFRSLLHIGVDQFVSKNFWLTDAIPFNVHPSASYRYLTLNNNIVDGRFVPLRVDYGSGPETIKNGIGLSSFFSVRYLLEPGVFKYLTGSIGLSCDYLDDQELGMKVEFFIGLDNDYNYKSTADLKYGAGMKKVFSKQMKPNTAPQDFRIELKDAKTLLIAAISRPQTINGQEKCHFPHLVLGEPLLINVTSS